MASVQFSMSYTCNRTDIIVKSCISTYDFYVHLLTITGVFSFSVRMSDNY